MHFVIPARFNGPDESGNGGVAAGYLADFVSGITQVRLLKPPPLDTTLELLEEGGTTSAVHGGEVFMTATPASLDIDGPPPVTWEEASAAEKRYEGSNFHGAPDCFVCGQNREPGDGLRIFPGPVNGDDLVAATWIPNPDLGGSDGVVRESIVWGALDCPGAWAAITAERSDKRYFPALGSMTLALDAPVLVGEPHVITARLIRVDGRKLITESALYSADGDLKARASHIEIKLRADSATAR